MRDVDKDIADVALRQACDNGLDDVEVWRSIGIILFNDAGGVEDRIGEQSRRDI